MCSRFMKILVAKLSITRSQLCHSIVTLKLETNAQFLLISIVPFGGKSKAGTPIPHCIAYIICLWNEMNSFWLKKSVVRGHVKKSKIEVLN